MIRVLHQNCRFFQLMILQSSTTFHHKFLCLTQRQTIYIPLGSVIGATQIWYSPTGFGLWHQEWCWWCSVLCISPFTREPLFRVCPCSLGTSSFRCLMPVKLHMCVKSYISLISRQEWEPFLEPGPPNFEFALPIVEWCHSGFSALSTLPCILPALETACKPGLHAQSFAKLAPGTSMNYRYHPVDLPAGHVSGISEFGTDEPYHQAIKGPHGIVPTCHCGPIRI